MKKINYVNPYETYVKGENANLNPILMGIFAIVMTLFVFGVPIWAGYQDSHYETVAEVYSVDASSTIFIDGAGYLWEVYDIDYNKGDFIKIKFNNNNTDYTRNDDKIVNVKVLDN